MRKLWYNQSAKNWNQALPIGNGRLGAMIFGEPIFDRIQINEETLWSGYPKNDSTLYDAAFMNNVRELVKNRKYNEANDAIKAVHKGEETAAYLSYGYINVDIISEKCDVTDYRRELNLENAVASSQFKLNGKKIEKYIRSFIVDAKGLIDPKMFGCS
jgi:alpha-L-fucosidase 2